MMCMKECVHHIWRHTSLKCTAPSGVPILARNWCSRTESSYVGVGLTSVYVLSVLEFHRHLAHGIEVASRGVACIDERAAEKMLTWWIATVVCINGL